jgi:catechol 2,3-dioxygenase-like lactoylglutathione lyase family enzyme
MEYKLEVVVVPVSDVDRAKAFYSEQVGFVVDVDHQPSEEFRVVQMTPVGSGCSVTIGKGLVDSAPGSLKGLQLCVADIEAARAELFARGVPVGAVQHKGETGWVEGKGEDWNSFIFFDDPDGNSWTVQESPVMRAASAAERETSEATAAPVGV